MIELRALAADWINAFNAHDLERILAHYRGDVRLTSPVFARYSGGRPTAQGLEEVRRYFQFGLNHYPDLNFRLREVAEGVSSFALRYDTNLGNRTCIECMEVDGNGRIFRVVCHYSDFAEGGVVG